MQASPFVLTLLVAGLGVGIVLSERIFRKRGGKSSNSGGVGADDGFGYSDAGSSWSGSENNCSDSSDSGGGDCGGGDGGGD